MYKIVLRKIIKGLFYGCAMFVAALIFIDICFDNSLSVLSHQYTRIALGAIVVGVGFVCSSLIYDEDRIPFVVRGLIQLVICVGVLLVGYFISGGIPDGTGFGVGVTTFLFSYGLLAYKQLSKNVVILFIKSGSSSLNLLLSRVF